MIFLKTFYYNMMWADEKNRSTLLEEKFLKSMTIGRLQETIAREFMVFDLLKMIAEHGSVFRNVTIRQILTIVGMLVISKLNIEFIEGDKIVESNKKDAVQLPYDDNCTVGR